MKTLEQRIKEDRITAEVSGLRDAPDYAGEAWDSGANWYVVTLKMGRRTMMVPFGMGPALTDEPTAADVLNCLTSDASGYENARSFEEWAGEYGYDTDSRKAERTYRQVQKQTRELEKFLGGKYHDYLWQTEAL